MAKNPKISEKIIQNLILNYLVAKKIFHYRNNTGAFRPEGGGFYRFGAKGSPDIVAVIKGQYIGIECKASRGGRQSEDQKAFQEKLEKAGGRYILATSLKDVMNL